MAKLFMAGKSVLISAQQKVLMNAVPAHLCLLVVVHHLVHNLEMKILRQIGALESSICTLKLLKEN